MRKELQRDGEGEIREEKSLGKKHIQYFISYILVLILPRIYTLIKITHSLRTKQQSDNNGMWLVGLLFGICWALAGPSRSRMLIGQAGIGSALLCTIRNSAVTGFANSMQFDNWGCPIRS